MCGLLWKMGDLFLRVHIQAFTIQWHFWYSAPDSSWKEQGNHELNRRPDFIVRHTDIRPPRGEEMEPYFSNQRFEKPKGRHSRRNRFPCWGAAECAKSLGWCACLLPEAGDIWGPSWICGKKRIFAFSDARGGSLIKLLRKLLTR